MGIGVGLVLIVVGAILAFAMDVSIAHLHLKIIGWILMIVGVVGVVLPLPMWMSRRRLTTGPGVEDPTVEQRVVEEIRSYDDPVQERGHDDPGF